MKDPNERSSNYRPASMELQEGEPHVTTTCTCASIDDTIIINVGGIKHEILRDTLRRIPDTLLSDTNNVQNHFRHRTNEYFFDRHPQVFAAILNYYRTGELHLPNDVCNVSIKNELEYWEIPETSIEDCCWMRYNSHWDQMNTLAQFETKHNARKKRHGNGKMSSACWTKWQPKIWAFLDDPYHSIAAKIFAYVSLTFVLISIFTFCAETHPYFMVNTTVEEYAVDNNLDLEDILGQLGYTQSDLFTTPSVEFDMSSSSANPQYDGGKINATNSTDGGGPTAGVTQTHPERATRGTQNASTDRGDHPPDEEGGSNSIAYDYILTETNPYMIAIDYFLYGFFTFEFLLRVIFCDDKRRFFKSFLNLVDLMAILPFYIEVMVNAIYGKDIYKQSILDVLLFTRIIRIFRVFRLIRHHRGLQILVFTIRASMKEILLLLLFLGIGMVIFASLIFYADQNSGTFRSIPHSFWWAVITMTTVGYGDVVPSTPWGFTVGSCCAVSGVLVIAFTVPVIVNNFLLIYQYVQFKRDHSGNATLGMTDPDKWSRKSRKTTNRVHIARHEFTNGTRPGWEPADTVNTSEVTVEAL